MNALQHKECSCCGAVKPIEEFQVRSASHDGRTAACKQCLKQRDASRYVKERERRLIRHAAYVKTESGRKASRRAHKRYQERSPLRRAAHVALNNALRDGRVARTPCQCCGALEVEAHHPDYDKPLDVVWLCQHDHLQLHQEHESYLNNSGPAAESQAA